MLSSKSKTCRALVWAVVLLMPMQSLPAATCGCASSKSCCKKDERSSDCCCSATKVRKGQCCCARKRAATTHSSCCSQEARRETSCCGTVKSEQGSGCNCGSNCQCGKGQQPRPTTPPVENNTTEKLANDSISTVSVATVYQPRTTQRHNDTSTAADALAALDRCASLCRFTL